MNSRERMLAAINHQAVDRIPTDIWATPEVMAKLQAHFGAGVDVRGQLHIDGLGSTWADYIGPATSACLAGESCDFWGMRYRSTSYGTGVYSEQVSHPLADARSRCCGTPAPGCAVRLYGALLHAQQVARPGAVAA